ncbi:MAG TPA: UDP-3-O-acyl-N-acetylglucosamine deacetylase [Terriglobia bacterium]|nr:UDP-3-O-acyl-N-acetylglucosamine deacetylase [Terriglobia bacterium]
MERNPVHQHTLAGRVKLSGVGLHTGVPVNLVLNPAPANTGIVFKRKDLEDFAIKARAANVARVAYATSLMRKGVLVSTTEHLLSALAALGIDNVYAEMDNIEVPILDGSSLPISREILNTGLKQQRARRAYLQIMKPLEIADGDKRISIYPANRFRATCSIDFPHPLIGKQTLDVTLTPENYLEEIAPARTFITLEEVEPLRQAGLVRGGSLENAIVLAPGGVMNAEGLRFADEFCRHKMLDLIGDLALLGHPVAGHVVAHRGGHAMHYSLVSRLLKDQAAWRLVDASQLEPQTSAA